MFSRIEKFIFLALIFSIPFQKRFFLFGPNPELVEGFEWSSGFLYFTDFLVALLFVFWLKDFLSRKNLNPRIDVRFGPPLFLAAFLGFAFVSLVQADLVGVAAYRFIKLAEVIFLFFYVASRAKIVGVKTILGVFIVSGVFQSILAILQFARQSSLGLEIFHESTLLIGAKGVAEISAGGVEFIRAYGTFPSPNVLAGFFGICLLFLFCIVLTTPSPSFVRGGSTGTPPLLTKARFARAKARRERGMGGVAWEVAKAAVLFFLSFGLLLTFSRGVIIFFLLATVLFFTGIFLFRQFKQYKKQAIHLVVLVVVSWLLITALAWPEVSARFLESSIGEPAIQERLFFNKIGADTVSQSYMQLFFGVGIGNFVHHYMQFLPGLAPHLYQPVHNIFILIASEMGVLGLLAFIVFLASLLKGAFQQLFLFSDDREQKIIIFTLPVVACLLLLIGMYDHYFWTLQQGSLMFWISLGLLYGVATDYNKRP